MHLEMFIFFALLLFLTNEIAKIIDAICEKYVKKNQSFFFVIYRGRLGLKITPNEIYFFIPIIIIFYSTVV